MHLSRVRRERKAQQSSSTPLICLINVDDNFVNYSEATKKREWYLSDQRNKKLKTFSSIIEQIYDACFLCAMPCSLIRFKKKRECIYLRTLIAKTFCSLQTKLSQIIFFYQYIKQKQKARAATAKIANKIYENNQKDLSRFIL